jgi:hypothetical protein
MNKEIRLVASELSEQEAAEALVYYFKWKKSMRRISDITAFFKHYGISAREYPKYIRIHITRKQEVNK